MNKAKIVLAGFAALIVVSSAALAQQASTGTVTKIDRITGTVGASSGSAAEESFKVQGALPETLHAGDRVTYSATETGGTKTITKLERQ